MVEGHEGFALISTFVKWLSDKGSDTFKALYRGHANERWSLTPSAFRDGPRGIVNDDQLKKWAQDAARFVSPRPIDPIGWLVLAQHHGIATPLLDWTTNPLTALFFASEEAKDANGQTNGCVYLVGREVFEDAGGTERQEPFLTRRIFPGLLDASAMNARSTAQDSFMSIHCEAILGWDRFASRHDPFVVPAKYKASVLDALRYLGFSAERLYVDIGRVVYQTNIRLDFENKFNQKFAPARDEN